jgi:NAD(P)-dependent dehydrogenase (short-subunit alcohol dehydrogenase family)
VEDRNDCLEDEQAVQSSDKTISLPRFHAIRADLGQRKEIHRLVSETVAVMGRLDVVVSNGGWTKLRKFVDLEDNVEENDWDRCFNMNVKSHVFLFHAAKEHLIASEGSFITTASVAGVKPSGSSLVRQQHGSNIPYD